MRVEVSTSTRSPGRLRWLKDGLVAASRDRPGGEATVYNPLVPRPGVSEGAVVKEHRWIVAVIYRLSEEEAVRAAKGQVVNLDHGHRMGVDGPGCLDCERPFEDVRGTACEAVPVEERAEDPSRP
jgi:hypothetical protein